MVLLLQFWGLTSPKAGLQISSHCLSKTSKFVFKKTKVAQLTHQALKDSSGTRWGLKPKIHNQDKFCGQLHYASYSTWGGCVQGKHSWHQKKPTRDENH